MKGNEQKLVYHVSRRCPSGMGCLLLSFLISCGVLAAALSVVNVDMPRGQRHKGEGRVYCRNDELMHFQVRQRSPLPLNLPDDVDPARQEEAASQALPEAYVPTMLPAPPLRVFAAAPDSCVLDAAGLLELPPEGLEEKGAKEKGDSSNGKEVEP